MRRVAVRITQKLNVGDYESIEPSVEVVDDVPEGTTLSAVYMELRKEAELLWRKEAMAQLDLVAKRRAGNDPLSGAISGVRNAK